MLCRSFWSRGVALAVVVALALAVAPSAAAFSLDLPQRGLALAWQAVLSWFTGADLVSLGSPTLGAKGGVTDPGEPPAPGEEVGPHWDPFG